MKKSSYIIHVLKQFSPGALFQTFLAFIELSRNLSSFNRVCIAHIYVKVLFRPFFQFPGSAIYVQFWRHHLPMLKV